MYGIISLEEISGGSFIEILRNLVLKCIPDGETILKILSDYSVLFLLLGVMAGILQCFFGYRVRRLWTALLFIVLCGCGGAFLAKEFLLPTTGLAAVTAVAAILGGLVGYFLWGIGCFVRPFLVISIAVFAGFAINEQHTLGLIVGLAAGLIAGIVTAAFNRVCLILYTALSGGLLAGACILKLFEVVDYTVFIVGGLLALVGFCTQLLLNRKIKENGELSGDGAETSAKEAAGQSEVVSQVDMALQNDMASQDGTVLQNGMEPQNSMVLQNSMASQNGMPLQNGIPSQDGIASQGGTALQGGMAASQLAAAEEGGLPGNDVIGQPASEGEGQNSTQACAGAENGTREHAGGAADDGKSAAAGLCPSCGTPYSARAKFCMYCGRKLQV